jgi:hypothetical protein
MDRTHKTKKSSVHFLVYDEFIGLLQEFRYLASFLKRVDKLAILAGIFMLFGVFLPWMSIPGHPTFTGLMAGGDFHLIIALATFFQVRTVARSHIKVMRKKGYESLLPLRLRRVALNYILLGFVSTIFAIFILVYFGTQHKIINNIIDIRIGFYITTFSGLGLFFCGIERLRSH